MGKKKYSIKDDFSMLAILVIPVGVAVNFVGGAIGITFETADVP